MVSIGRHVTLMVFGVSLLLGATGCTLPALSSQDKPPSYAELAPHLADSLGKGHSVILDFQTPFCLACFKLKPKLEKTIQKTHGVSLVTLNVQKLDAHGQALSKLFRVTTAPHVVFIGRDGVVLKTLLDDAPQSEIDKLATQLAKTKGLQK